MKKEVTYITIGVVFILAISLGIFTLYQFSSKQTIIIPEENAPVQETIKPAVVEEPIQIAESPKEVTILISRYEFDKPNITIETGTKVIWKNTDDRRHMITDQSDGFLRNLRKSLEYGDTFEYTFDNPGTYKILEANFGIRGIVTVTGKTSSLITGSVVGPLSFDNLDAKDLPVVSLNIFAISMTLLIFGFYISRYRLF